MVGFVLLDLRRAAMKRALPAYAQLQSSAYGHDKPEILCAINVELESTPGSGEAADEAGTGGDVDVGGGEPGQDMEVAGLRVRLRDHDGVYVIDKGGAPYLFSLTVGGTHSLDAFESLARERCAAPHGPFYFYYSFLGNDVMTEVFDSLVAPVFAIERASIRLELAPSLSLQVLSALSPLQLYLCCGETALAVAHIPLERLGGVASELTIEDAFPLAALPGQGEAPSAVGSVYVVASFSPGLRPPPPPASLLEWQAMAAVAQAEAALRCWRLSIDVRSIKDLDYPAASLFIRYSYPELGSAAPFATHPVVEHVAGTTVSELLLPNSFCAYEFVASEAFLRSTLETAPLHIEVWHRDKYVKDILLGIAAVHLDSVLDADATVGPVSLAGTGGEATELRTFDAYVVVASLGDDDAPGAAALPTRVAELRVVLSLENMGGAPPGLPSLDARAGAPVRGLVPDAAAVVTTHDRPVDGPHAAPPSTVNPQARPQKDKDEADDEAGDTAGNEGLGNEPASPARHDWPARAAATGPANPRDAPEYLAAWELEVWKQEQEAAFQAKLEAREAAHLALLQAKFKEKEKLRIQVHERKRAEYARLEAQMRKALREVQERERRLVAGEQALERRSATLQDEYERRVDELNDKSRRFRDSLNAKHREVLGQLQRARAEADAAKADARKAAKKLDAATDAIRKLQADVARSPTLQMEAQLEALVTKVETLESEKAHVASAKKHYRTQWVKALKEIARLQDREKENALAGASAAASASSSHALADAREDVARMLEEHQRKMQDELQTIKLASAAREHALAMQLEKQELVALKAELSAAASAQSAGSRPHDHSLAAEGSEVFGLLNSPSPAPSSPDSPPPPAPASRDELLTSLERLIDEREALLASGVYAESDAVVAQVDKALDEVRAQLAVTPL
ncbi:coiled-coil domain containing 100 [Thecamonas trahens ATCC 50062]|uniref:Coiled-coil domain containing 100 n=1 Tax=Thecamonas trahens ATCC 50062 TaxID=461836 RepID=A0A0L0DUT8_THETB|nr:coiled-coil domain containing 100 [Thecamonas trahens ATCC 50062]KNC56000.1 coiled-coil domain containing 100 [Thecamonas trahens ATCC 50062]|eukprot:XP_013761046.1 coiled-coil domain containing 100 [Thecamonas trahens ATCC 50062]